MRDTIQHIDSFSSDLGQINLTLSINGKDIVASQEYVEDRKILETNAHKIEVIAFQNIKNWLADTDFKIKDSKGWIIRIIKLNDLQEALSFKCYMDEISDEVVSRVDCGEHLHAVWIEDETNVVSIGTEDGEVMKTRALKNDWMPNRFKDLLGYHKYQELSITDILDFGFQTNIPDLLEGERIYFHYLVATNARKKSNDYPDEDDISTNLAVDYPKRTLIDKLNIEE